MPPPVTAMKHFDRFLPEEIEQKLRQIRRLERSVFKVLPDEYRQWVRVGGIEDDCLTLVVHKQTVAANIRFFADELQRTIHRDHQIGINRTRVKVVPNRMSVQQERKKPRPPESAEARLHRERLRKVLRRIED